VDLAIANWSAGAAYELVSSAWSFDRDVTSKLQVLRLSNTCRYCLPVLPAATACRTACRHCLPGTACRYCLPVLLAGTACPACRDLSCPTTWCICHILCCGLQSSKRKNISASLLVSATAICTAVQGAVLLAWDLY